MQLINLVFLVINVFELVSLRCNFNSLKRGIRAGIAPTQDRPTVAVHWSSACFFSSSLFRSCIGRSPPLANFLVFPSCGSPFKRVFSCLRLLVRVFSPLRNNTHFERQIHRQLVTLYVQYRTDGNNGLKRREDLEL